MVRPKKNQQHPNLQEAIKETARKQIGEHGASTLSLRAIARELNITAPAIYNYFSSRDDLVTSLIGEAYEALRIALEEARQKNLTQNFKDQLLAVGMAYREWGIMHPEEYSLIFGTPIPGYHAPDDVVVPMEESSLGVLNAIIEGGLTSGEFHSPEKIAAISTDFVHSLVDSAHKIAPILHIALALWGHVHGLVSLELYNHLQPLVDDPAEFFRLELLAKVETLI